MTPTASVVVTTYATPAELLALSLDSLLGQTLSDIEVVLVVDGELGPTATDVVQIREQADPRLVVLRPGRVGRARALNLGVHAASAPLVGIQDADDASHPRRLEVQASLLAADPQLALLGTGYRVSTSLTETADWTLPGDATGRGARAVTVGDALLRSNPIVHSSVLARASALERVGGYDERRRAQFDYELLLRLHGAGEVLALVDLPLVMHRRHPDQFFEGLAPVQRAWGSYRLQQSHIAVLPPLRRLSYSAVAVGRLGYQVARGMAWHRSSRRRTEAGG
ncbi:MAG: glycosyltransferase [Acidimicrobiales bacterium]